MVDEVKVAISGTSGEKSSVETLMEGGNDYNIKGRRM